jgi:transposase-like protein
MYEYKCSCGSQFGKTSGPQLESEVPPLKAEVVALAFTNLEMEVRVVFLFSE